MNTKHYLPTILLFTVIALSVFSSNAQNSSDLIRMAKKTFGYAYYKDNERLNFSQIIQLTTSNPTSLKLTEQAYYMRYAGYAFSGIGGFSLGFALGHALGRAVAGKSIDEKLFYPLLGAGAGLIVVGICLEFGAINKTKHAVAAYNNAIRQENNTNLDLGFSPGGVMLRLNF